jgi:hypothetical protein
MEAHPSTNLLATAWGIVSFGAIWLSAMILKWAPSDREETHSTTPIVGTVFVLVGLSAGAYMVILLTNGSH